jgi:hypothetical protein
MAKDWCHLSLSILETSLIYLFYPDGSVIYVRYNFTILKLLLDNELYQKNFCLSKGSFSPWFR